MSLEAIGREIEALDRYLQAIRVFADIPGITLPLTDTFLVNLPATTQGLTGAKVLPTPARPASTRATPTFLSHREAHRWVATALTRATIISARTKDLNRTTRLARTYHVISKMWPTTFRSSQQAFMLSLYLRALHAGHAGSRSGTASSAEVDWLVCDIPNSISSNVRGTKSQLWSREWIEAVKEGKRLLSETTTFPRAGQTNWKVQRFVEDAMDVWERAGCGISEAKEVVKIMWWSVEMTFHSQAILRHLMRLLLATGQHDDAKRVFELYVKLVLKARQTSQPEVSLELRQSSRDEHSATRPAVQKTDDAEFTGETEGQEDMDRDEDFLEGLLLGARILTQDIGDPIEAWRYISLASDVLAIASPRVAKLYGARVEESKGIIRMAMAIEDAEPMTRPTYQSEGIGHLVAATELASGDARIWYHLAYARTEARDLSGALDAVRQALELEPTNAEAWHLLGLLLTATKDWAGALRAVQAGIDLWETVEQELKQSLIVDDDKLSAVPVGIEPRDYAMRNSASDSTPETSPQAALISGQTIFPISKRSNKSLYPTPSVTARLGNVIQLRITQAVITEKLHGPDEAMIRQQENFAYFSGRSGYSRPGGQTSPGLVDDRSVRDLGESFFNVNETTPAGIPYMGETQISKSVRCWARITIWSQLIDYQYSLTATRTSRRTNLVSVFDNPRGIRRRVSAPIRK
jgi:tetratricopeptide (TPR) repeat protein